MILGAQSRYFKDACKQEGSDGTHDLTDNDTGAVDAMITFMYKQYYSCLLYTSPSPRDGLLSRMPSSA